MSTEDLSAERAAFENWLRGEFGFSPRLLNRRDFPDSERHGDYCDRGVQFQWHAWQARASSAAAVPGWKLVPVEPTREMLKAVDDEAEDKYLARGRAASAWKSMLAATPAPPQADHFPDAGKMVPPQAVPARHLTVTTNNEGDAVMVSWQDDEHRVLEVVWERAPAAPVAVDAADVPETNFGKMPPLPKPRTLSRGDEDGALQLGYTADQMREYARAALRTVGAGRRDKEDAEALRLFDLYATNLLNGADAQACVTRDNFRALLAARGKE